MQVPFQTVTARIAVAVTACCALAAPAAGAELPPPAARLVDFAADVQPILHSRCYACHGPSVQMNGLRLDRRDAALKGGGSGPAIVPADSASSALVLRTASSEQGFRMPPTDPRLTRQEVGLLRAWIDQGAHWPEDAEAGAAISVAPSSEHWSFQPITSPQPPPVGRDEWVRNPIDRFVLAKLESEGVDPSPEADRLTLLRRLSLDLIGLPPTWEQAQAFLADASPEAYERVVDELLDSKHYGEKWARHWLDLARYADSDGYEKDLARPWAWRWREWVIDAFNQDLPFDEFTTLQLAADLLPDPAPDQLAATGFHRNTLRNREGGTIYEQSRFEETLDRVNTVATTWLALTVECAQCHDHKYDPITQRDFYSLYAYFDNVEDLQIDAPLPGEMGPYLNQWPEYLRKRQELLEEHHVPELQPEWERQMRIAGANPGQRTDWDLCYDVLFQMTDNGWHVLNKEPSERSFREREVLTAYFIDWYYTVVSEERIKELGFKQLRAKLKDLKASYPQLSRARVIRQRSEPRQTFLRERGQWDLKGPPVEPRPPAFLLGSAAPLRPTRLDLAEWLLSEGNPLTARVAVNRMWQEFFGRGLASTSEDFGLQGEAPSHPELLDWLASQFREGGWSVKRLHKLIVLSAAYRQSSDVRPEMAEMDPDNALLARQNRLRLPAEILRDAALRVSGLLYPKVGGPSVYPPQPAGVVDLTYGWDTDRWQDSRGPDRYRRGLYTFFQRTAPYPQLMNFDAPDSNRTASRRRRSNTPLQALNLMNDEVFVEAARALAVRVLSEAEPSWSSRLRRMVQLTLGRPPASAEAAHLAESFQRQHRLLAQAPSEAERLARVNLRDHETSEVAAWIGVGRALMNTDEFITRE